VVPFDAEEKMPYRCTTTVNPVYNSPKDILKMYFLYDLVHTNLFIPSHFWTTNAKIDNCCQHYMATYGKNFI